MERQFHPVADLFPLMQGAAFAELVADVKKHGLIEPILVDVKGRILDGRNRYRACLEAGVEPRFTEWKGEGELPELALSLNLRRRHLNESQRAMVAARLAKMMETEAVRRKGKRTDLDADLHRGQWRRSASEAAALVNVSTRLVNDAIKIMQTGCPALIVAVESRGLAVTPAAVLAGRPKDEQAKAVAGGAKHAAAKAREVRKANLNPRAARPSPWRYGVVPVTVTDPAAPIILWVSPDGLDDAMDALQAHGFEFAPTRVTFQPGQTL